MNEETKPNSASLYVPQLEHDSCGIGFIADLKNRASHQVIEDALTMLENMEHRGGRGSEPETGDGAGILIQTPHAFLVEECAKIGLKLPEYGKYGVGVAFFSQDSQVRQACKERIAEIAELLGLEILGYRTVPVNRSGIGAMSLAVEPNIEQVFVQAKQDLESPDILEKKLFILRKQSTHSIGSTSRGRAILGNNYEFYWASLSYKVLIYKGQLRTDQLGSYYEDLRDYRLESALAQVHSRFSTNTVPKWKLAQPFRYLAHNGEINTIRGNVNWMKSKEVLFKTTNFSQEEIDLILPVCDKAHSDSANLDAIFEMLLLSGRSMAEVMMILIPEAWQAHSLMDDVKKAYYEFYSSLMEPWDGPASICFTDGKIIGATLDRNGLRPSRYVITADDRLIMSSEAGALPIDESKALRKGRLQPGKIFIADLEKGRIIEDEELKNEICQAQPYREWLDQNKMRLEDFAAPDQEAPTLREDTLLNRQIAFGYTREDLNMILGPMVEKKSEPIGSMGADTPLALLSKKAQHLSFYFKQLFAQVSNPPIDPIREKVIMSLFTNLGPVLNILGASPEHCRQIHLDHPILTNADLAKFQNIDGPSFRSQTFKALFKADGQEGRLEKAVDELCQEVEKAVNQGVNLIVLSDRGISAQEAPIPSLLICGAVHHHLIRKRMRAKASIIIEAGDVIETHHYATLLGYGANAINPYLSLDTIDGLAQGSSIEKEEAPESAQSRYIQAINYGLRKVFSKMGISTLQSYQGAQIFEVLGIGHSVIEKCFTDSISRIGGLDFDDIARERLMNFHQAFPKGNTPNQMLPAGGLYQWKKEGESHLFNPKTIHLLQKSTQSNQYPVYKKYAEAINAQLEAKFTLRGLLDFVNLNPIPIEEVEPIEAILPRFATGAMSFGSISHEAHSTLAIAMNRIGAKSNSGEGGEDEIRFERKENGDWERSAIKQIASGRFGVTSHYLSNADELQIKMAQGAKPGEGGQLPGHKVDDWIGRVRHSTPGVGLISPPPHHDIYSIEDLAQLIFDLKNANREARINVKLVAEAGVGTIAAGVAKAKADVVLISGHDGGTGASPLSSIRHAGLPWELGLSEAHQTLVKNKLRNRIRVQADGQMRTGRDLAIATLLGAEEWGIATAALVVEGCIMMRKCHLNTCPVGIATQRPELREKFKGKAEHVVNFFRFLAQDLREIMASLGFRSIDEMVGQVDKLKFKEDLAHWKLDKINLDPILYKQEAGAEAGLYQEIQQDFKLGEVLDWQLLEKAQSALSHAQSVKASFKIVNTNRAVGALLSNEVSKKYQSKGLPEGSIDFHFKGSAGQSFGAFLAPGIKFELEGESNDYFGKGLSGGQLVVYPHHESQLKAEANMIIGNVAFYGGTSGEAFIRGMAGERFAVRNSGVKAVVEGVGDHACEYMTGGQVIILGDTGRNFAAGMSGGLAYVYDPKDRFEARCNPELVDIDPLNEEDFEMLKTMLEKHLKFTGSDVASHILAEWEKASEYFLKVIPRDYKAILEKKSSLAAL